MKESFLFVSTFAAFYAANIELWLHKPPTAKQGDRVDGNFALYLFFHKLNFPFRKTRNFSGDLGELSQKFSISSAGFAFFLFTLSVETFLSLSPHSMMAKSILDRIEFLSTLQHFARKSSQQTLKGSSTLSLNQRDQARPKNETKNDKKKSKRTKKFLNS